MDMRRLLFYLLVMSCLFHAGIAMSQMCTVFQDGTGKYGLKQKYGDPEKIGKIVTPAIYDEIEFKSYCGAWMTSKNGRLGFLDDWGTEMLPNIYQGVLDYHAGIFFVVKDLKIGAVDRNNNTVLPFEYEDMDPIIKDAYQKLFLMEKMDFKTLYTNYFKYYTDMNHLSFQQDKLRKHFHNIKLDNVVIVISSENKNFKPCDEYYQNTLKPIAWKESSFQFIFVDVSSNKEMVTEWQRFRKWGLGGSELFPAVVYLPKLNPYHLVGKTNITEFNQFIEESSDDEFRTTMDMYLYGY